MTTRTAPTKPPPPLLIRQEMVDPRTLKPDPGNPRVHQTARMAQGVKDFKGKVTSTGQYKGSITVNERTGLLVTGHGTVEALIANNTEWVQVGYIDVDPDTAEELLVWDNWSSDNASNEPRLLAELLGKLSEGPGLERTGFNNDDLSTLLAGLPPIEDFAPGDDDETEEPAPEDAIALAGVVVGEPPITTKNGDVWKLDRHYLAVCDVHTDHHIFTTLLTPGCLFWPYPTLLAPFADKAKQDPVVMVQPSTYLAGWLLTKWQRITGTEPHLIAGKGAK